MIKSILKSGALALGLMTAVVSGAHAATITVSGTGQIFTVGDAFSSTFATGGAASFELVYDSDAAALVSSANFARYPFISATLTFAKSAGGTESISADGSAIFEISRSDDGAGGIFEAVILEDSTGQVFAGVASSRVQIGLLGVGALLTDLSPPTALDIANVAVGVFRVVDESGTSVNLISDIQTLTVSVAQDPSVVPLPAGGLLLISGLVLLGAQRRRRAV